MGSYDDEKSGTEAEARGVQEKTEVIYGIENIIRVAVTNISNSNERIDICGDKDLPIVHTKSDLIMNEFIKAKDRGVKIRFVTDITKDNLEYCRQNMRFAELRHLNGVKGNFGMNDSNYQASANLRDSARVTTLLHSNDREFVEQQRYLFETLWDKAVPASVRMRQLEFGIEPEKTEVVYEQDKIIALVGETMASAKVRIDNCVTDIMPERFINDSLLHEGLISLRKRGVRLRFIT